MRVILLETKWNFKPNSKKIVKKKKKVENKSGKGNGIIYVSFFQL